MELKNFVSETIKHVIDGVINAQEYATAKGARVNPRLAYMPKQATQMWELKTEQPVQFIEFDIAVTASEGTKTQGGVSVLVGVFGLASKGQSEESNQKLNRIKFSIPVGLPVCK
jgi:hypothetical protein